MTYHDKGASYEQSIAPSTQIRIDGGKTCSLALLGKTSDGRLAGLTAGHCGKVGSAVFTSAIPGRALGTLSASDLLIDVGLITFDGSVLSAPDAASVSALAATAPAVGDTVCQVSPETGTNCSFVGGIDEIERRVLANYCSLPGDSGAPVYFNDKLVGMNLGNVGNRGDLGRNFDIPCEDAVSAVPHNFAFYRPIQDVLNVAGSLTFSDVGFSPLQ
ncbi:hypothetical protein HQ305_06810 [Rhodococcus sp. BP-149]|uniref:S1 family peptidase n=1 Tax=unclassified Rhodococcus (in: high G+C Gram-positive bacteria) TaxID=192944 RepID=UPI001C9A6FC7|nr:MULTISPECIES: S1 family peptidase [unclassified Rhodococcus (in: high G+C Gram-positive bacteria)]MBY6681855.1 hypothetical protein [Rhodococcus sp. BP-316]MBY6683985.1 hypothetical protein [Rhodococcus sp. BP-288]MBY6693354.1 hypothetical protein [Rhodococcus sp. BP-188]MBY6697551.1 hypothetical protein [Rhodococcus sp. BP-285]MBY6702228.1 hypothetical protein [Rhodococcus sp. BP-283]